MTPDTIDLTVERYIHEYGVEKNLIVLVEELSELQQAICKHLRYGEKAVIRKTKEELIDDIRSEVADVLYCLHYLRGVTDNTWKDYMEMATDRAIENQERLNERVKE